MYGVKHMVMKLQKESKTYQIESTPESYLLEGNLGFLSFSFLVLDWVDLEEKYKGIREDRGICINWVCSRTKIEGGRGGGRL